MPANRHQIVVHADGDPLNNDPSNLSIVEAPDDLTIELTKALAFAQSVIKSGEGWTPECEQVIGGMLLAARHHGVRIRATERQS